MTLVSGNFLKKIKRIRSFCFPYAGYKLQVTNIHLESTVTDSPMLCRKSWEKPEEEFAFCQTATRCQCWIIWPQRVVHFLGCHYAPVRGCDRLRLGGMPGRWHTASKTRNRDSYVFWCVILSLINHFSFLDSHPVSQGYLNQYFPVFPVINHLNIGFQSQHITGLSLVPIGLLYIINFSEVVHRVLRNSISFTVC